MKRLPTLCSRHFCVVYAGLGLAGGLWSVTKLQAGAFEQWQKSILLSWHEAAAEEQIVVGTKTLGGPWAPVREPIFERGGPKCVAVPIAHGDQWLEPNQYFRLAAGYQLVDDFSDPSRIWTVCSPDPREFRADHSDGSLRITSPTPGAWSRAYLAPFPLQAGEAFAHADYVMSIDLLAWDPSEPKQQIGLIARSTVPPPQCGSEILTNHAYIGLVAFSRPATVGIYANPPNAFLLKRSVELDSTKVYRLMFSGVGSQLILRFLDLEDLSDVVDPLVVNDSEMSEGVPGVWCHAKEGAYDVTFDNYFVSAGTRASP